MNSSLKTTFQTILRRHIAAIILALFVGCCAVAPTILSQRSLGNAYKGIHYLYLNDETIYLSRIHEILDGHPSVSSPFLYEYKDSVAVVPPINEYFYALPYYLFGVFGTILFAKFFFPAILFLLVYVLVFEILRYFDPNSRILTALGAGLSVTLGYDFVDVSLLRTIFTDAPTVHLLAWTRLVNPIVGVLIVFSTFLFSWKIFSGEIRGMGFFLAVPLALSVGYFFSFAVCYGIVALLVFISLLRREYGIALIFILSMVISVVLDAIYWYHMFTLLGGDAGRVASLRNGMYYYHHLIVNKLVLLVTLLVGVMYLYQHFKEHSVIIKTYREWLFIGAMLATGWLVYGQQLFTGKTVWPEHFVQFTVPMMMVSLLVVGAMTMSRWFPRFWIISMFLVMFLTMSYGLYSASSYRYNLADFTRQQEQYGDLLLWLKQNAQSECVVLSREWNEELERLIPAYTKCNVYNTQYVYSVIPPSRILHNFLVRMRLEGVDPEKVEEYLYANENNVRGYFFENWDHLYMRTQGKDEWLKTKVELIAKEYRSAVKDNLGESLREYRIDYFYSKTALSPEMLSEVGNVSVVATSSQFILYEVR